MSHEMFTIIDMIDDLPAYDFVTLFKDAWRNIHQNPAIVEDPEAYFSALEWLIERR